MQTSLGDRIGYHIVRRVAPPESPFAGLLARDDTGTTSLLVGVGEPLGWPTGASWGDGEHMLVPLDVIAAPAGNEVVLPWCTEPVEAFLERRRLSGQELMAGEAVTLGVCVIRGARDAIGAEGAGCEANGEWWLTGDGQPMFVPRAATEARAVHTAIAVHTATLDAIAGSARDRGIEQLMRSSAARVTEATVSCDRSVAPGRWAATVGAALDACEDELFATSSPAPLEMRSLRPRVARSLSGGEFDRVLIGEDPGGVRGGAGAERDPERRHTAKLGGRIWRFATGQLKDAAARHVDPDIADAATDTWRRTRGSVARGLRRPVVVGLVLAILVVCVGVLWPTDEGGVASRDTTVPEFEAQQEQGTEAPAVEPPESSEAPAVAPPETSVAPPELEGLPAVASSLLTARSACGDAAECTQRIYEDADAASRVALPAPEASSLRAIDAAASARSVALVDDLGGVAVLRVERAGSPSEMLIVVQTERGWRIRDVFDVLDAPPTGGS